MEPLCRFSSWPPDYVDFYPGVHLNAEHHKVSPDKSQECDIPVDCQLIISCVHTLIWPVDSLLDESGTHLLHARFQGPSFSLCYKALFTGTGVIRHGICYKGSLPETLLQPLSDCLIYAEVLSREVWACSPPLLTWVWAGWCWGHPCADVPQPGH